MTWFKVDDSMWSHPKVLSIPKRRRFAAMGAWLAAGLWSAAHLTDGVVPDAVLDELGVPTSARDDLVRVSLWSRRSPGVSFVNWDEYQPTREQVEAKRRSAAERVTRWRENRRSEAVQGSV